MSGERSCGAPGRLSEARGGRRVWSRVTMHTYATARANQGPGSGQSGAHAIGTAATRSLPRARAVRCAAAATDGQRWGWQRAPLHVRSDVLDAGLARLPSRHPRSGAASRDLCGLPGPVPRAPAARGSTEAPQRLLQAPWSGWRSPPRSTQRAPTRGFAGRCGVIRSEGGGNTSWMDGREPLPCWSQRLATSSPELKRQRTEAPSEAGPA